MRYRGDSGRAVRIPRRLEASALGGQRDVREWLFYETILQNFVVCGYSSGRRLIHPSARPGELLVSPQNILNA